MDKNRNTLKSDLNRIIDLYQQGIRLKETLSKVHNKPGLYRKYLLDLNSNKSRFKHNTQKLLSRIQSSIITVEYSIGDQIFFSRLTNLSKEDVPDLFEFIATLYGLNIKILEIKEIPTFLKSPKL